MNKELIEILRELEKKRIASVCEYGFPLCMEVSCKNCFMYSFRKNKDYLNIIFSISL